MISLFCVREANQDDVLGIAKVRVDTWKAVYRGIVPATFLDSLSYQEVAERWKRAFWERREPRVAVFVAETKQQEIVGIAICGPEQSQDPMYQAEIYVLYVLPDYQNQGIGRELVGACVQHFRQQLRVDTMLIWVIAENPYRRFYELLGGKVVKEKKKEIGGKMILEVGYGWEQIEALAMKKTA